jgi:hypothetical protein
VAFFDKGLDASLMHSEDYFLRWMRRHRPDMVDEDGGGVETDGVMLSNGQKPIPYSRRASVIRRSHEHRKQERRRAA